MPDRDCVRAVISLQEQSQRIVLESGDLPFAVSNVFVVVLSLSGGQLIFRKGEQVADDDLDDLARYVELRDIVVEIPVLMQGGALLRRGPRSSSSCVSSGEMTQSRDGVKLQLSSEIPVYTSVRLWDEQSDRGRTMVRLLSSIPCS
jgi:hypothetical protein